MQQVVTETRAGEPLKIEASNRILILYYGATVLFLALDFLVGFNIRIAFLDAYPMARLAYYGFCFLCLALMLWRPAWTVLISAFESLVTLSALIIGTGMRVLILTDRTLETGEGVVTLPEIYNFLIAGSIGYLAWFRGVRQLQRQNTR